MTFRPSNFKAYSRFNGQSETEPHVEGVFGTEQEAQEYIKLWEEIYANKGVEFWISAS